MVKDEICMCRRKNGKYFLEYQNIESRKYKSKSMENRFRRYNGYLVRVLEKESRDNIGKGMEERYQLLD